MAGIVAKVAVFLLGAGVGMYTAVYLMIAGNDRVGLGRVAAILSAPPYLLTELLFPAARNAAGPGATTRMGWYVVFLLTWWALLGGAAALGAAWAIQRGRRAMGA